MPKFVMIIPIIFFVLIFLVGLINAINPKFMWRIFESWKATKQPSAMYFRTRRIIGIVIMVIAAAFFVYPYIMRFFDS